MRRCSPVRAHLIWIKDVFGFSFIRQGRACITQSLAGAEPCVCFKPGCHSDCFALGAFSLALRAVNWRYEALKCRTHVPSFHFSSTATRYGQTLANLEDTCASWLPSLPPIAALLTATRMAAKVAGGDPRPSNDIQSTISVFIFLISPRNVWVKKKKAPHFLKAM